jgi:hypothetical protein
MLQCLVKELGADVNQVEIAGRTILSFAAQEGLFAMAKILVKDLGADINHINSKAGTTPLMIATASKHADVFKWLIKEGADLSTSSSVFGTAADISREFRASAEQTSYLEAKTHCSHPGCSGAGLLKCTGFKQARYCGEACQLAHWKAHKADCRRLSTELAESINASE